MTNTADNTNSYTVPAISEITPPHAIKKTPVILTIFFSIITAGLYYPCWFLTRRKAFNSFSTYDKLHVIPFIFVIVIFSISIILNCISGYWEMMGEENFDMAALHRAHGIDQVDRLITSIAGIVLVVQCFKARRILRDHFNLSLGRNVEFCGVTLFFLGIFYLQYKINRL